MACTPYNSCGGGTLNGYTTCRIFYSLLAVYIVCAGMRLYTTRFGMSQDEVVFLLEE